MKWITREHPRVDRVACPWLIERFVDKQAEFIYVPNDQVATEAERQGATPYDTKGHITTEAEARVSMELSRRWALRCDRQC